MPETTFIYTSVMVDLVFAMDVVLDKDLRCLLLCSSVLQLYELVCLHINNQYLNDECLVILQF